MEPIVQDHTEDIDYRTILLDYATERYLNRDLNPFRKKRPEINVNFEPCQFEPFPKTYDEMKYLLGRQWKVNLCLLGSFFEEYKNITSNYLENPERPVSILALSSTSRNLVSIFKSKSNVSRVIKKLIRTRGLVKVRGYRFGTRYGSENYSSAYAYNKSIEKLVLKMIDYYRLNDDIGNNHDDRESDISLCSIFAIDHEKCYNVKVSSKLKIANCTDEKCTEILDRKYASLVNPRRMKISEMNEMLPPEQKITMDWNIHRSAKGFVTKIGTRATSRIVSLKEHADEHTGYSGVWRREYLDEQFGIGKWFDYDVHGSIYQLTHLLNYGQWLGNETDPYAEMFGRGFETEEQRQAYKSLCMSLYFDYTSKILSNNRMRTPDSLKKHGKVELAEVIGGAIESMRRFTGETFDSEIFLHESLMYIDFVYALRKRGVRVVQVYDGFYFKVGSVEIEDLERLMRDCALDYLEDYRRWKDGR